MKYTAVIIFSACALVWLMRMNTYNSDRLERHINDTGIASYAEHYEGTANQFSPQYQKILLVILDGARRDLLYSEQFAPRLYARWRAGGLRYTHVRAAAPTVTSPNMASLLTGATSFLHGVTSNSPRHRARVKVQTVHECLKRRGLSSRVVGFNWYEEMLGDSVPYSAAECCGKDDSRELAGIALEMIRERRLPFFTQLHFLAPDNAAHATNSNSSPRYLEAIREIDGLLDEAVTALKGAYPGALVIVTADHGMSDDGTHGGSDRETMLIPLYFLAANFPSAEIEREITSLSIAPTVAALAGARLPSLGAGTPLREILDRPRLASYLSEAIDKKERIVEALRGYPSRALTLAGDSLESLQARNDDLEGEISVFPQGIGERSLYYQRLAAPLLLILFILWTLYRSPRGAPAIFALCGTFVAVPGFFIGFVNSNWSSSLASASLLVLAFILTVMTCRFLLDESLLHRMAAPRFWPEILSGIAVETVILSAFFAPFYTIAPDPRVYPFRFFTLCLACPFLAAALLYLLSRLSARGKGMDRA